MEFLIGKQMPPETPPTQEEKTMALLGVALSFLFPLVAPLVMYLVQKDKMPFTARVCWRFMVFDGVVLAVAIVTSIVMSILSVIPILGCLVFCLMIVLVGGVGLWALAVTIFGLIRINEGMDFIPPFADQLLPPPPFVPGPPPAQAPPSEPPTTPLDPPPA